jgi:peptidoglycan/LPS O-acetylase OafA/YrhL
MKYRPDIDGLRGLAVLLVVLFHAGFPYVTGGFIGVDIFFVISGYLITSIIVDDAKKQHFSYVHFYERRIRRILPALYVMAVVVLFVALLIQMPLDLIKTAKALLFSTLSLSNVFFWRTTDYFSSASEFEFFLHTWSLCVEEQFYFFFPIVILCFLKKGKWLLGLTVAAFVISFAFSVYTSYYHEWASYYLLPSRAWQMMMGAVLAIIVIEFSVGRRLANVLAVLAALCILFPLFFYTKGTRFPGLSAFVPTFGAALIIFIGSTCTGSWLTRVLSCSWIKFIGIISYSLYLWHWPIFAFLRNYQADTQLSLFFSLAGLLLSFLMAYLSWRFIESPFRDKTLFSRKAVFVVMGASSGLLVCLCLAIVFLQGVPSRIDPQIISLSSVIKDAAINSPCMNKKSEDIKKGNVCSLGDERVDQVSVALWGDSHSGALKNSFSLAVEEKGKKGVFLGKTGCPPILGVLKKNISDGEECLSFNDEAFRLILSNNSIKTVFLHARWALSVEGTRYMSERGVNYVLVDVENESLHLTNADIVERSLNRTLRGLLLAGKKVVIIASVPEVGFSVPKVAANNLFWGKSRDIRPSIKAFVHRQSMTNQIFETLKASYPMVEFIYPSDKLCDASVCHIMLEGESLYFDTNHLSDLGSGIVVEQLKNFF